MMLFNLVNTLLKFIEMSRKARQNRKELNLIEPGGPFQLEPGLALFLEKAATRFNRSDPLFLQQSVLELCTLLMTFSAGGGEGCGFEQLYALCSESCRDDKYQSLSENQNFSKEGRAGLRAVSLQYLFWAQQTAGVVLSARLQGILSENPEFTCNPVFISSIWLLKLSKKWSAATLSISVNHLYLLRIGLQLRYYKV